MQHRQLCILQLHPYTGDHPDCVRKNQELLCAALPFTPRELVIPFQTHGISSLIIDETYLNATHSERQSMLQGVDALITRTPGCCICISTADCIPILLYDKEHHAIAAVHAGWRGTVRHILTHTLRRMQATCGTEGKDIIACIGPGISFASFEVGDEVHEAFCAEGFPMEQISAWKPETHKYHIDLWKANHLQLSDFGVAFPADRDRRHLHLPAARGLLLGATAGHQVGTHTVGNNAERIGEAEDIRDIE